MSLPLLHAGRTNPGLSAALDLRFALDKSLTAYRGPTPSFSRASTGSYFDGSGVLRYANVNTILYSEQLENAYWFKSGLSISADSTVAPDGKTTADKVVENASSGIKYGTIAGGFSVVSGTTYTFSAYAKDYGRYFGFATNSTAFPNAIGAVFNLTNGTISNIQANTTASIQSVGNGWYRCIITGTANASATTNINFGISNDLNQIYPSYSGNGSSGYFLWGFQMETGSTVGTYCPTTSSANSAPRFDHTFNGTSWVSRGLLVEEQRTNVVLNSANFTSGWTTANVAMATSSGTSPDGTNTAVKLYPTASTTQTRIYRSSTQSCISVFAKAAEKGFVYFYDLTGVGVCWFNLSTGAIGTNGTSLSASIVNCGNGWFRCSLAASSGSFSFFQIGVSDADGSTSSTASGTNGILIWGAQEEAGSFATSYIPTTSASATRSADVCQITGTDFSGFWNASEGSFAVEYDRIFTPSSSAKWIMQIDDGTNSERIGFVYEPSAAPVGDQMFVIDGGSLQARVGSGSFVSATPGKFASCYKLNDFAATLNGSAVNTDTSGTLPTVNKIDIGRSQPDSNYLNGHIARLRYYAIRLPNRLLIAKSQ